LHHRARRVRWRRLGWLHEILSRPPLVMA
jgi:hypothetical protein